MAIRLDLRAPQFPISDGWDADMPSPIRDPDGYLLWAQSQSPERRREVRALVEQLQGPERDRLLRLLDERAPN